MPKVLLDRPQWVGYRLERRRGQPKLTKVPYAVTGGKASSTDPDTWASFDDAWATYIKRGYAGVGFVFAADDPFTGVDLDNCRDRHTGVLQPWATAILDQLASWAEVSPSGTGVHIIAQASLPGSGRKTTYETGALEMYDRGRFFTITGQHVAGTPMTIELRQAAVLELHAKVFPQRPSISVAGVASQPNGLDDRRLLELAFKARNGAAVAALWQGRIDGYGSQSEADLALANHLTWWAGRDPQRIDRLFRLSGLFRSKWDERRGQLTYGQRTIDAAIAGSASYFGDGSPRLLPPLKRPDGGTLPPLVRPVAVGLPALEQPASQCLPPLSRP